MARGANGEHNRGGLFGRRREHDPRAGEDRPQSGGAVAAGEGAAAEPAAEESRFERLRRLFSRRRAARPEAVPEEGAGIRAPFGGAAPAGGAAPESPPEAPPGAKPAPGQAAEAERRRLARVRQALARTGRGLGRIFGRKKIDEALLEELETQLLGADLGVELTAELIDALAARVRRRELGDPEALGRALGALLMEILAPCEQPLLVDKARPFSILVVGVNGVGKTTTIAKLAAHFKAQGTLGGARRR
ncbi:MAG: hypothetical protein KatS3mg124_2084 [Porticoccaceae bacterium]|nr:MAG: hypothetical protein KatS3mg124_2084 [Porticoccaceae bacterium]